MKFKPKKADWFGLGVAFIISGALIYTIGLKMLGNGYKLYDVSVVVRFGLILPALAFGIIASIIKRVLLKKGFLPLDKNFSSFRISAIYLILECAMLTPYLMVFHWIIFVIFN